MLHNSRCSSQELLKKGCVAFSMISLQERQFFQWALACISMAPQFKSSQKLTSGNNCKT